MVPSHRTEVPAPHCPSSGFWVGSAHLPSGGVGAPLSTLLDLQVCVQVSGLSCMGLWVEETSSQ